MAKRDPIDDILFKIHFAKTIRIIPTEKNIRTFRHFSIFGKDEARDHVRELARCDYIKGPEPDYDIRYTDSFWFFKKIYSNDSNSDVIYIKLKYISKDDSIKVVSWHLDNL